MILAAPARTRGRVRVGLRVRIAGFKSSHDISFATVTQACQCRDRGFQVHLLADGKVQVTSQHAAGRLFRAIIIRVMISDSSSLEKPLHGRPGCGQPL